MKKHAKQYFSNSKLQIKKVRFKNMKCDIPDYLQNHNIPCLLIIEIRRKIKTSSRQRNNNKRYSKINFDVSKTSHETSQQKLKMKHTVKFSKALGSG